MRTGAKAPVLRPGAATPPTTQDAGGARPILRPDQERQALETILKNPKNRDVQIWAKRRFLDLTEPERKLA